MRFSEIDYNPEQQILLAHLVDINAVLETIILTPNERVVDVYETSRFAAISAMRLLAIKYDLRFEKIKHEFNVQSFKLEIFDDQEPIGKNISFEEFIGPGYDLESQKLTLYTYGTNHYAKYNTTTEGFVYALIETPYGLRHPNIKKAKYSNALEHDVQLTTELIRSYFKIILAVKNIADAGQLMIYSWSTDWSNYFDDGKEWWGEFCWTIYNPIENKITFIAAAATD